MESLTRFSTPSQISMSPFEEKNLGESASNDPSIQDPLQRTASPELLPTHNALKLIPIGDLPDEVRANYKKYGRLEEKQAFRNGILEALGPYATEFKELAQTLKDDGMVVFRDLLQAQNFATFVNRYDAAMSAANHSAIGHTFLNFRKEPDFLKDPVFNSLFFDPLLLTLISYGTGDPIRLVDVRGKDTAPTLTVDRDNGIHVDDSPFDDELKIILLWEKSTGRGPSGQNFVALPGTHKLVRRLATEHGANFKTPAEIIDHLLCNPALGGPVPVIEAHDPAPLAIVFEATALAHQRFRTDAKTSTRSCMIFAFHNDREHFPPFIDVAEGELNSLVRFVLGAPVKTSFIDLIAENRDTIGQKLMELKSRPTPGIARASEYKMEPDQVIDWLTTLGRTNLRTDDKPKFTNTDLQLDPEQRLEKFLTIMDFDKHYDLDMAIYPDRHERTRKEARNRMRERGISEIRNRPASMERFRAVQDFSSNSALDIDQLQRIAIDAAGHIDSITTLLHSDLTTRQREDFASIRQLALDLGEALSRCGTTQLLRSNSIFLYWCLDEISEFLSHHSSSNRLTELKTAIEPQSLAVLKSYAAAVVNDDLAFLPKASDESTLRESITAHLRLGGASGRGLAEASLDVEAN